VKRLDLRRHAGFSLVELTIVLTAIGLLAGAILFGQELVASSRGKAVAIELNDLQGAVATYRDRYRALPGDDPLAQARWSLTAVPAASPSSPGNGSIDGAYNASAAVPEVESRLFWWHLRRAGFLRGATDPANPALAVQQPQNALGGITGVTTGVGALSAGLSGPIVCTANVPGRIAAAIDAQTDDGAPAKGDLRAKRQTVANENIGTAADTYVEHGGLYLLCRTLP
jgi:prepilin-type N-terminal cleavage/methylation domain-containing protein